MLTYCLMLVCLCCYSAYSQIQRWKSQLTDTVSGFSVPQLLMNGDYFGYYLYHEKYDDPNNRIGVSSNFCRTLQRKRSSGLGSTFMIAQYPDSRVVITTINGTIIEYDTMNREWRAKNDLASEYGQSGDLSVCMGRFGELYAGAKVGSVLRSSDFGETWHVLPWFARGGVNQILYGDGNLFVRTSIYDEKMQRIYRSTDCGNSWEEISLKVILNEGHKDWNSLWGESLSLSYANGKLFYIYQPHPFKDTGKEDSILFRDPRTGVIERGLFECNPDGSAWKALYIDSTSMVSYAFSHFPQFICLDSSGGVHGINNKRYLIHLPATAAEWTYSGRMGAVAPEDTVQLIKPATPGAGISNLTKLQLLADGYLHISPTHYRSLFRIPTPPMMLAQMQRCGYATCTFVSDTLVSVIPDMLSSRNVRYRFDTLRAGRSVQVHVEVGNPLIPAYCRVVARNTMGKESVFATWLYPKPEQKLTLIQQSGKPDSLDAGDAVMYTWELNGNRIIDPRSGFPSSVRRIPLLQSGEYTCTVFDTTGCVQTTPAYTHTAVGVEETGAEQRATIEVQPNPISGSADISFTLPRSGIAYVAVYDALGKEVAVLADGYKHAGRHTARLQTETLSAGVYYCRMITDGTTRTTTLVVME